MSRKIIGIHSPTVPYLGRGSKRRILLAVLVEDDGTNTQVAYQGIVDHEDGEEVGSAAVAVSLRGSKLKYEEAQRHWPSIERKRYQHQ